MLKSKFFRVAVEGMTASDGRKIERSWIEDIAAGYNPLTYGARVNMEHIRGFSPTPPFNAYGDVTGARSAEIEIELNGKKEKRLALEVQIDPTNELVELTKKRQKIYTSIEVAPNFAGTGKAGLVGLAVTDSPASLGTEILAFSTSATDGAAAAVKADIDRRKQDPANLFSATYETAIELDAAADTQPSLRDQAKQFFSEIFGAATPPAKVENEAKPESAPQGEMAKLAAGLESGFAKLTEALDARFATIANDVAAARKETADLKTSLDGRENLSLQRPPVTGASGSFELTDC